jgi:hypothetical protein
MLGVGERAGFAAMELKSSGRGEGYEDRNPRFI